MRVRGFYEWSSEKKPYRSAGSGTPVEYGFADDLT